MLDKILEKYLNEVSPAKQGINTAKKDDLIRIANDVLDFLKRKPEGRHSDTDKDYGNDIQVHNNVVYAGIRYWGSWEVPPDEVDDGDYDWRRLTKQSHIKLKGYIDEFSKQHKNFKITYSTGEKDWIEIEVSKK